MERALFRLLAIIQARQQLSALLLEGMTYGQIAHLVVNARDRQLVQMGDQGMEVTQAGREWMLQNQRRLGLSGIDAWVPMRTDCNLGSDEIPDVYVPARSRSLEGGM